MRYIKIGAGLLLFCAIAYFAMPRHPKKAEANYQVVTVSAKPMNKVLYFSGTLQPLKTIVVTAPVDGVIDDMPFHYGDQVQEKQVLFQIISEKFQKDYKTELTQYIKAKTDYMTSDVQLKESTFLYQHQLISRDDFNNKKVSYYNARFSFVQAKESLGHILQRLDLHGVNPFDLKIDQIDKIANALRIEDGAKHLQVTAPASGVVLLPSKDDGHDGSLKKISKGTPVKQDDVLAVISDLSSLIVHISVSEFDVNRLHVGQEVTVTGAAFPEYTLTGKIIGLDRQGQPNQSGLPAFAVDVAVMHLTETQKKVIHVGMSAQVAIHLNGKPVISIPLNAVLQKGDKTFVRLQDKQTRMIKQVAVKTGATTMDSVVIESSLHDGDSVVIPG